MKNIQTSKQNNDLDFIKELRNQLSDFYRQSPYFSTDNQLEEESKFLFEGVEDADFVHQIRDEYIDSIRL